MGREGRTHPRMIGSKRLLLTFVVIAAQAVEDLPSSLPWGRIYGGTDAEPGEFPHLVSKDQGHMLKFALEKKIFFSGEFPQLVLITRDGAIGTTIVCTGSLISEKAVVTAGHCCDGMPASLMGVVVGNYKMSEQDPDEECISVEKVHLHENYNSFNIQNDICTLVLQTKVTLGPNVGIIRLPEPGEEYAEGTECQAAGWGITSNGEMARVTQKANVTVLSDS